MLHIILSLILSLCPQFTIPQHWSGVGSNVNPITFINHVCGPATPASGGGSSAAVNMTGATFYVITMSISTFSPLTVMDSNSDTFVTIPATLQGGANFAYAQGITGTSAVTFSLTGTGTQPGFCVMGFSGIKPTSAYENVNSFYATCCTPATIQAGSVTPTANYNLFIAELAWNSTSANTIDSGYTAFCFPQVSTNYGNCGAYLIHAGTAASNPTWSMSAANSNISAGIAVFQGN